VTVLESVPETAEVVRCSACGAPRFGHAADCVFCEASFTLHEQDLDTLCPQCAHRVSSKGRYCHHCGTPVLHGHAGGHTDYLCPACPEEPSLRSRPLGQGTAVLECNHCAGLWLEWPVFQHLEEQTRLGAPVSAPGSGSSGSHNPVTHDGSRPGASFYRACVECGKLMQRQNYGGGSGVLVDTCRDHGVWFDHDELARALAWIRKGGPERQHQKKKEELAEMERRRRLLENSKTVLYPTETGVGSRGSAGSLLTEMFFGFLSDL
jgi:Zn-finger nucleic acid-binding protein